MGNINKQETLIHKLQQLHLSENEAAVYVALLETGQTSAGELIKKTLLHRSVVYETLDKLIDKKLVVKVLKQNIAYFQNADPARFLQNIKALEHVAQQLIPEMETLMQTKRPEITVYEGKESFQRFWIELAEKLPAGSTHSVSGATGKKWYENMEESQETFLMLLKQKNIRWKMILYEKEQQDVELQKQYGNLYELRLLEKNVEPLGNFNIINGESIILHSAVEPMVIEVRHSTLARVFQNIFDILWSIARPLE